MCILATVCILTAAKLEQPISPSFSKMLSLLSEDERKTITIKQMITLEEDILVKLSFDFNFATPIQSMERYLRLLNYDQNQIVYDMSYQICKF
jgi:ACT domain-containing protein